jgi:hypothetical protein
MEMQSLRETMEGLEAEFARLELQKRIAEEGTASGDDQTTPSAIQLPKSEEYESAKQRFNEIVGIKAQLRKENEALQRAISEHRRYALKAASWIRLGQFVSSERESGTVRGASGIDTSFWTQTLEWIFVSTRTLGRFLSAPSTLSR